MRISALNARMSRFEKLCLGLMVERDLWRKCDAPVLYTERRDYQEAISKAIAGLEEARKILANAVHRLDKDRRKGK
jgi:hypothetical protein